MQNSGNDDGHYNNGSTDDSFPKANKAAVDFLDSIGKDLNRISHSDTRS